MSAEENQKSAGGCSDMDFMSLVGKFVEMTAKPRDLSLFVFCTAVVPTFIASSVFAPSMIDGTYKGSDAVRFFDVLAVCVLLFEVVVDITAFFYAYHQGKNGNVVNVSLRGNRLMTFFVRPVLVIVCFAGYALGSVYNFAFLSVCRINDWFWIWGNRPHSFSSSIIRATYLAAMYTGVLAMFAFVSAVIGQHLFRTEGDAAGPFRDLQEGFLVVTAYMSGGNWCVFVDELNELGFGTSAVIFACVFMIIGFILYRAVYIAFMADSMIVEELKNMKKRRASNLEKKDASSPNHEKPKARRGQDTVFPSDGPLFRALKLLIDEYDNQHGEIIRLYWQVYRRLELLSGSVSVPDTVGETRHQGQRTGKKAKTAWRVRKDCDATEMEKEYNRVMKARGTTDAKIARLCADANPTILIIGGNGCIGSLLHKKWSEQDSKFEVHTTDSGNDAWQSRPDFVIDVTAIDEVQKYSEGWKANMMNNPSKWTVNVAESCKRFIHLSTDMVYHGDNGGYTEAIEAVPDGSHEYGLSMRNAEVALLMTIPATIIRCGIIITPEANFRELESVPKRCADVIRSLTFADDVVWAIDRIITDDCSHTGSDVPVRMIINMCCDGSGLKELDIAKSGRIIDQASLCGWHLEGTEGKVVNVDMTMNNGRLRGLLGIPRGTTNYKVGNRVPFEGPVDGRLEVSDEQHT